MDNVSLVSPRPLSAQSRATAIAEIERVRDEDDDLLELPASASFRLYELPSLSGLTALMYVNLKGHGLPEFPRCLLELPRLRGVDLTANQLTKIPADIDKMSRLADLDLSENAIEMVDGKECAMAEVLPTLFAMEWMTRIVLQKNRIGAGWQQKLLDMGGKAKVTVLIAGCTVPT